MSKRSHDAARPSPLRRQLLRTAAAVPLVVLGARVAQARRTPSATEGPFYPTPAMRFSDVDNDLVRIGDAVKRAGGEVILLKGRVLDRQGAPLAGARVEIWQCDAAGRYLHTGDPRRVRRDAAFQGFGHDITDADGRYWFRTIKPVPYPGRAPHIHVKVLHDNRALTTQFYIDGHRQNGRDVLFRRMSPAARRTVAMKFADGNDGLETNVDIWL